MESQKRAENLRRSRVVVNGPGMEKEAVMGASESIRAVADESGQCLVHDEDTFLAECVAGDVLHSPGEIASICCVCKGYLCKEHSKVVCSHENHLAPVCPNDRVRISPDGEPPVYLCQPHYEEWVRERIIIGLVVLFIVCAVALALFVWLR